MTGAGFAQAEPAFVVLPLTIDQPRVALSPSMRVRATIRVRVSVLVPALSGCSRRSISRTVWTCLGEKEIPREDGERAEQGSGTIS